VDFKVQTAQQAWAERRCKVTIRVFLLAMVEMYYHLLPGGSVYNPDATVGGRRLPQTQGKVTRREYSIERKHRPKNGIGLVRDLDLEVQRGRICLKNCTFPCSMQPRSKSGSCKPQQIWELILLVLEHYISCRCLQLEATVAMIAINDTMTGWQPLRRWQWAGRCSLISWKYEILLDSGCGSISQCPCPANISSLWSNFEILYSTSMTHTTSPALSILGGVKAPRSGVETGYEEGELQCTRCDRISMAFRQVDSNWI